jgi:hypothetical protein
MHSLASRSDIARICRPVQSAYVSIRQHTSAYLNIRGSLDGCSVCHES